MTTTTADWPRLSYRPAELAAATGIKLPTVYRLIRDGVIPRLPNCGKSVVVPAWAVSAWEATGDWRHPAFRPPHWAEGRAS